MPCLTSLREHDSGGIDGHTILPSIVASCPKLSHVDVGYPSLPLRLRSHLRLACQLQSLPLRDYFAGREWFGRRMAPTADELTTGFAGMASLDSLTVDNVAVIDSLLPFVAHAPCLAHLTILASDRQAQYPSAGVLYDLLSSAAALHCTVIGDRLAKASRQELHKKLKQFGPRLRLML